MKRLIASTALALLAIVPALAQSADTRTGTGKAPMQHSDSMGPAGMKSTEMSTGATGNANDVEPQNFVTKVAMTDEFEIESSKLALQKSQDPEVKKFAQRMIDDHKKASDKLKAALQSGGANMSPPTGMTLDAKHKDIMDKLKAASGKEFDREYLKAQADGHKAAVELFRTYAKSGDDDVLKGFAADVLPTIELHYQHVQKLDRPAL